MQVKEVITIKDKIGYTGTGRFVKVGDRTWECEDCCSIDYFTREIILGGKITGSIRCRKCGNYDTGDEY